MITDFSSVLVANRGEIALRIMRTLRAEGLECIAVYTDADVMAPYVSFADRAINIGSGPISDSYLNAAKILKVAVETGADAIHPGYGFLSENTEFAAACIAAGLVFIGPPATAVELMGNKAAAKRKMIAAGVPCIPGYEGEDQSEEVLESKAKDIGFPVMIKAAEGGGGRGMRLVSDADSFHDMLNSAKSEALNAFGSDEMILEKALVRPRHVEIQIFADSRGNIVHLGERDCSVQRRHQKILEESPCATMTDELRSKMGSAAIEAAQSVAYQGAGTVEFLLDEDNNFYFLEMNTRLQVEHPVTEMVTGHDLVSLQLQVARGEALGFTQEDVVLTGHAIEVRLYAEDTSNDFVPSTGLIERWRSGQNLGIRVDYGISEKQEISPFYDPMLAKIIAFAPTREEARKRLQASLRDTVLFGPTTNRDFLVELIDNKTFVDGTATTAFVSETFDAPSAPKFTDIATAAALHHRHLAESALACSVSVAPEMLGWGSLGYLKSRVDVRCSGISYALSLTNERDGRLLVSDEDQTATVTFDPLRVNGKRVDLRDFMATYDRIFMATNSKTLTLDIMRATNASNKTARGNVTAPMHGLLLEVKVSVGDEIHDGAKLAVLEAMKMRHELRAEVSGIVTHVRDCGQVRAGEILVEIERN